MIEFNEEAKKLEQDMEEKHQAELEDFISTIDEQFPGKPKDSSELLNMRKIEKRLVK